MTSLTNKIFVLTGGSGLIGKDILTRIRENGGIVINADIAVATDVENGEVQTDITNEASVRSLIYQVVAKHGRIDGWINNAYPRTSDWGLRMEDLPYESWQKNVDLQLNSYYLCCKLVAEQMKLQNGGSIVNITSIYGVVGPDFTVYEGTDLVNPIAYSAIKGGVINLTRYLASYLGGYNIRVNCVSPGGIFDNQNPVFVRNYEKKVPLKRMGKPQDIGGPVAFLLSDDAGYITGHNLLVDGGWTAV